LYDVALERKLIVLTVVFTRMQDIKVLPGLSTTVKSCLTLLPVESFILAIELNFDQCCIDLLTTLVSVRILLGSGHLVSELVESDLKWNFTTYAQDDDLNIG